MIRTAAATFLAALFIAGCGESQPTPAASPAPPPTNPDALTLVIGGDVMLSRNVARDVRRNFGGDFAAPFANIAPVLGQADIAFFNLECPISGRGRRLANKTYVFNAPKEAIAGVVASGVDVVSLANNHTLDYGEVALADTERLLTEHSIRYTGLATDGEDDDGAVVVEAKGVRVGFLAYADPGSRYAYSPGFDVFPRKPRKASLEAIRSDVPALRARCDMVVVSIHWGTEYTFYPTERQRELGEAAIDAGALVVAGHHPHVVQPVERYKDGVIAYSLGNLVFDQHYRPSTRDSQLVRVSVTDGAVASVDLIPYWVNDDWQPTPRDDVADAHTLVTESMSVHEKFNAHESIESWEALERLRAANKDLNITRTALIGHYDEVFIEHKKWNTRDYTFANNELVLEAAARYPGEFEPVMLVDPRDRNALARLDGYRERGAVAAQVYEWMFAGDWTHARYAEFFDYFEAHDFPLILRASILEDDGAAKVDALLRARPALRVLIPHFMVGDRQPERVRALLAAHENLYFDISYGFKSWRTEHFAIISKNRDALRDIVEDFPGRVLFATDIVVSNEPWKTEDYIYRSFRDFIGLLEKDPFPYSVLGRSLNGFALAESVLDRVYRTNFLDFFGGDVAPSEARAAATEHFAGLARAPDATGSGRVRLVVGGPFLDPALNLSTERGRAQIPDSIDEVLVSESLRPIGPPPIVGVAPRYVSVEELRQRMLDERNLLALVPLAEAGPWLHAHRVDGQSPFDGSKGAYAFAAAIPNGYRGTGAPVGAESFTTVAVTGSSLIGQGLAERAPELSAAQWAGPFAAELAKTDVTILSNETSFIDGCENDLRAFTFCSDTRDLAVLEALGVDLVSLTGNHLVDYGEDAFRATLDAFRQEGIGYYGGGASDSFDEISDVITVNGTRLGFIGFDDISFARQVATATRAGSNDLSLGDIARDVTRLRGACDVLFVDVQAGNEFAEQPTYYQRRIAAVAQGAGADAVTFLHSHVAKGMEFLGEAPVFYGPGNFLFLHPDDAQPTDKAFYITYTLFDGRIAGATPTPVTIGERGLSEGDSGWLNARLDRVSAMANRKSAMHTVTAFGYGLESLPQSSHARIRTHFSVEAASLPEGIATLPPDALFDERGNALDEPNTYILWSFDSPGAMDGFMERVQADRDAVRARVIGHADKILFGGGLFELPKCDSLRCRFFAVYQTLDAYRNLLECDRFSWPTWDITGGEWSYDYVAERDVVGLDLPDETLRRIYFENAQSLLHSR